uniref:Uncharacterized protein n=1 Tax=Anguilla anguilla TaxID=7936 RepID=A0A0E9UYM2_ANGAN
MEQHPSPTKVNDKKPF